jgi:hypothetical protein
VLPGDVVPARLPGEDVPPTEGVGEADLAGRRGELLLVVVLRGARPHLVADRAAVLSRALLAVALDERRIADVTTPCDRGHAVTGSRRAMWDT